MIPAGAMPGSRIVKIEDAAGDPQTAASAVHEQLALYTPRKGDVLNAPVVLPDKRVSLASAGGALIRPD